MNKYINQPTILVNNIKVFKEISNEIALLLCNDFVQNDCLLIKDILTDEIKEYLKNNIIFNKHNAVDDERQFYREHNDEECGEFIQIFNNKIKMDINEGDIVIFRGRNHLHWRDKKYVKDYRAILLHTEDYTYNNKLVSYIYDNEGLIKVDINNIKNINIYHLTDLNNYEKFRHDYVMYFN